MDTYHHIERLIPKPRQGGIHFPELAILDLVEIFTGQDKIVMGVIDTDHQSGSGSQLRENTAISAAQFQYAVSGHDPFQYMRQLGIQISAHSRRCDIITLLQPLAGEILFIVTGHGSRYRGPQQEKSVHHVFPDGSIDPVRSISAGPTIRRPLSVFPRN